MSCTDMDAIDAGTTPLCWLPTPMVMVRAANSPVPTPNAVYSINVSGQRNCCDPVADSIPRRGRNEPEELIRCRAKADICALHLRRRHGAKMYGQSQKYLFLESAVQQVDFERSNQRHEVLTWVLKPQPTSTA